MCLVVCMVCGILYTFVRMLYMCMFTFKQYLAVCVGYHDAHFLISTFGW